MPNVCATIIAFANDAEEARELMRFQAGQYDGEESLSIRIVRGDKPKR